jgi:hypothetical protein
LGLQAARVSQRGVPVMKTRFGLRKLEVTRRPGSWTSKEGSGYSQAGSLEDRVGVIRTVGVSQVLGWRTPCRFCGPDIEQADDSAGENRIAVAGIGVLSCCRRMQPTELIAALAGEYPGEGIVRIISEAWMRPSLWSRSAPSLLSPAHISSAQMSSSVTQGSEPGRRLRGAPSAFAGSSRHFAYPHSCRLRKMRGLSVGRPTSSWPRERLADPVAPAAPRLGVVPDRHPVAGCDPCRAWLP